VDAHGPLDLIRLAGATGNAVVVRVTGRSHTDYGEESGILLGEIAVSGDFVSGTLRTWIFPEDLTEWGEALDAIEGGADTVSWREDQRETELRVELEEDPDTALDRATVWVADRATTLTAVELTMDLPEGWVHEQRECLAAVRRRWPAGG
jgi:uncharacterized protein DUF5959